MRFTSLFLVIAAIVISTLASCSGGSGVTGRDISGFDEFGYNDPARIFNGIYDGVDQVLGNQLADPYANDHLVMKWNAAWDRGNEVNWAPAYQSEFEDAHISNNWNGQADGSGEVWQYKIIWIGTPANSTNPNWRTDGVAIWGQFQVIFSHGTVANEHFWDVHADPAGFGAAN